MLALIYLATTIVLGACVCRRFYCFNSWLHYLAASFLVGLVLSTWATYLLALAFAWSSKPLVGANVLFFLLAVLAIYNLRPRSMFDPTLSRFRPAGSTVWDAVFIGAFLVAACYLMFGTLWLKDGNVKMAFVVWNDFGPNLSLVQSFAVGHNFPTEYPHFIGPPIRYHFLFWFQAGNLEFLGLNMAWALNLISVLSLLAMLILLMTLGEALFNSRAVGRIGASLFFFPTTLSYAPFLRSQGSFSRAVDAVKHLNHWLWSGYSYRGEDWGIWSLGIYYVQRHLTVATGALLMVLIFVVRRYRDFSDNETKRSPSTRVVKPEPNALPKTAPDTLPDDATRSESLAESTTEMGSLSAPTRAKQEPAFTKQTLGGTLPGFVFSGVLLGLLPMWNSAVFVGAAAVLAVLLILFPLRLQMLALGVAAGMIALPQLIYLSIDGVHTPKLLHWGFTLPDPTMWNVTKYLAFTFGYKWLLIALALVFATGLQRRMFLALSSLILVAFSFQFSIELLINHKFLNTWVTLINLFAAYGLCQLWRARVIGKAAAVVLTVSVTLGGFIEWFRIHNDTIVDVPFRQNRLSDWLQANTTPKDVFLSDRFILHPILLNGRRIFYGWPYFAWGSGYPTGPRDVLYEQMLTEKDPSKLVHLLHQNGIRYVAIDNGIRLGFLKGKLNESVFKRNFERVFEDKENRFGALTIYRVPGSLNDGADLREIKRQALAKSYPLRRVAEESLEASDDELQEDHAGKGLTAR